jgi:hypothetical protein
MPQVVEPQLRWDQLQHFESLLHPRRLALLRPAAFVDLAGGRVCAADDGAERAEDVPLEQPVAVAGAEDGGVEEPGLQP